VTPTSRIAPDRPLDRLMLEAQPPRSSLGRWPIGSIRFLTSDIMNTSQQVWSTYESR